MKAKSFQADSLPELESQLKEALADGFEPTQAFVFASNSWDLSALRELFRPSGVSVFGATTWGEFIGGDYNLESAVVLLTDMPADAFELFDRPIAAEKEFETAADLARLARSQFDNPAFLLVTSHVETVVEDIIAGIESVTGPEVDIFGGMSAAASDALKPIVFTADIEMDRGIVLLVLDADRIEINGVATCGWSPVGPIKTVTKSDGMWVYEIDGEPTLDLMLRYSGACTKEELTPQVWLDEFVMSLAPQLIREDGDNVMRPGIVYDAESGAVLYNGRVPEGSKIRFSVSPDENVVDAVISACRSMKETRAPEADAIVYFSCAGRRISLGPLLKRELRTVQQLWNAPMAGFFSTGEIARATGGRNELNNLTSACVVLKEK